MPEQEKHQPPEEKKSVKTEVSDLQAEVQRLRVDTEPDEKVFEVVPKHVGKVMPTAIAAGGITILSIVSILTYAFFATPGPALIIGVTVILAVLSLMLSSYGLSEWYNYRQSGFIITDKRLINVDQSTIMSRKIDEIKLETIQKAEGQYDTQPGQIFKYGSVSVHQIGEDEPTTFPYVPVPAVLAQQIMHFHNLVAHGGVQAAHNAQATSIKEDQTPELASVAQQAEQIAESKGIKSGAESPPPPPPQTAQQAAQASLSPQRPPVPTTPPQSLPNAFPPPQTNSIPSAIFSFEISKEKAVELVETIPATTEPDVNFSPSDQTVEIKAIVPEPQADKSVDELQKAGAENIKKNGFTQ